MKKFVTNFYADQSGATAIEYGLIAALIGVGIIAAASLLGNSVASLFNPTETAVGDVEELTDARIS